MPTSKAGEKREESGKERVREEKGGGGGLSGDVTEEAFCLKSRLGMEGEEDREGGMILPTSNSWIRHC